MINLLKEMFSEMVVKKNADLIPVYYHSELLMYANNKIMDYQEFLDFHVHYYATDIQYYVEYDEETWVVQENKLAGRIFITIKKPDEPERKIEVILIIHYKDNKIFRLWELTYPDWSQMPVFKIDDDK